MQPGTQLAFEENVSFVGAVGAMFPIFGYRTVESTVATFVRFAERISFSDGHRDALGFPDGKSVLVTRLRAGQRCAVLQVPPERRPIEPNITIRTAAASQRVDASFSDGSNIASSIS
jgi:hypothetical protein